MSRWPTHAMIALTAGLALSACVSFGPKPAKSLLTLSPTATIAAGTVRTSGPGASVTVLNPTTPAAIATTRIAVYDGATSIAYVKDAAWNDAPSRLFAGLLAETIGVRTGRVVVSLRQYSTNPGEQLSGQLQKFGIDSATMQAVVIYDGLIAKPDGSIQSRRFEGRVPVSEVEPAGSGRAINQAANDVAVQIADWLKR